MDPFRLIAARWAAPPVCGAYSASDVTLQCAAVAHEKFASIVAINELRVLVE